MGSLRSVNNNPLSHCAVLAPSEMPFNSALHDIVEVATVDCFLVRHITKRLLM